MSDSPLQEVLALRQRVQELEQLVARSQAEGAARNTNEERLNSIVDALEDVVWSQSAETFEVLFLNPAVETIYGHPPEAFYRDRDLWLSTIHPDDVPAVLGYLPAMLEHDYAEIEYRVIRPDGQIRWIHDRGRTTRDSNGNPLRVDGIATDITPRKRAEEERERQRQQEELIRTQEQVIEAQRAALRELSTPLIPLATGVVAMPLVGTIDSQRAEQIIETLLYGIVEQQADVAILDITGVRVMDTQVANAIIRTAQAVKLLGAEVVLTGIRAEVAQTLVFLGADLSSIVTRSTLQSGTAYAMERQIGVRG